MRNRNQSSNARILLEKFKRELKLRGRSNTTANAYRVCLQRFLSNNQGKDVTRFSLTEIQDYQEHLIDQKLRPAYINQHLFAINFFYSHVVRTRRFDPRDIGRLPIPKEVPTTIPKETIKKMFNAMDDMKFKMIFYLMYATGMRVHEAVKLRKEDIKSDRMLIHIVGKGNKERFVPMSKDLLIRLREYYSSYPAEKKEWMFPRERNMFHHVSTHHVACVLRKIRAELKLSSDYTCHSFRHSFAGHSLENGVDIRLIQKVLGHADIRTTMHYVSVSEESLRNIKLPTSFL